MENKKTSCKKIGNEAFWEVFLTRFCESEARATRFKKLSQQIFELLAKTLDEHTFSPDKIYNYDEFSMSVVRKTRSEESLELEKKSGDVNFSHSRCSVNLFQFCTFLIATDEVHQFKGNPVLHLLDRHATHTQNPQLIDGLRNNGVTVICFPPHTIHRL